jgi:hypothetical protein
MVIGGWIALKGMGLDRAQAPVEQPTKPGEAVPIDDPPAGVRGRKRPEAYGLPSFPTAFDFQSMDTGKQSGSTAFVIKKGTAAEVVRFYVEKLGALGWQYEWKRSANVSPGGEGQKVRMKGSRVRWIKRNERRQLTLLTLDDPQKGRSAQAVLSWAPIPTGRSRSR